jgi:hypothetical protein
LRRGEQRKYSDVSDEDDDDLEDEMRDQVPEDTEDYADRQHIDPRFRRLAG